MRRSVSVTTASVLLALALAGCSPADADEAAPTTPAAAAPEQAAAAEPDAEPTHLVSGDPFSMPDLECTDLVPYFGDHVDPSDVLDSYRDEEKLKCDWRKDPSRLDVHGTQGAGIQIATSDYDKARIDKLVTNPIGGFTRPEALEHVGGALLWHDDGTKGFHGGTGTVYLPGLSITVAGLGYDPGSGMTSDEAVSIALAVVGR